MNIQTALLPHKHVRFSESTLALAGRIRMLLVQPRSVDELWSMVSHNADRWPSVSSFTQLVLALDVLYAIGQVNATVDGRVFNVPSSKSPDSAL
jgi:hypothetical protein